MPQPYNQQNLNYFIYTVELWLATIQDATQYFAESETKHPKDKAVGGRPFSILKMAAEKYIIISNMHIGQPGYFGRVKVAFNLICSASGIANIDYTKPIALKILTRKSVFHKSPHHYSPSDTGVKYMQTAFPETFMMNNRVSASTKHGVVKITEMQANTDYEVFNKRYYTLPLYECQTIHDYLLEKHVISVHDFFAISLAVAGELKRLHDKLFVHRDISLDNILIDRVDANNVIIYLIDFDSMGSVGVETYVSGTANFISAEKMLAYKNKTYAPIMPSQDIYAFARVLKLLHTMLTSSGKHALVNFNEQVDNFLMTPEKLARYDIDKTIAWLTQLKVKLLRERAFETPKERLKTKKITSFSKCHSFKCQFGERM